MSDLQRGEFGEVTLTVEYTAEGYDFLMSMFHEQNTTPRVLDAVGTAIAKTNDQLAACERRRNASA